MDAMLPPDIPLYRARVAQKLQAMDNSHVALVSLNLDKDAFSEFRCDRDMTLGMNLGSLTKIIKCANNDDSCKLSASEDADTLNLQFQGKSALRIHCDGPELY